MAHNGAVKDACRLFLRFNAYLARYRKSEALLLLCGSLSMLFSLIGPYLGKLILDNGILAKDMNAFLTYTIIGGVIYIFRQAVDRGTLLLKSYTTRRIKIDLARAVFKKTQALSLRSFRDRSIGGYVSRFNSDITASSGIIASTLPELLRVALRLVLITTIIFVINSKILLFILCYQLVMIVRIRYFARKQDELAEASYKKGWEMSKALTRIFSQIYIVKAAGSMAAMARRYFRSFLDSIRLEVAVSKLEFISEALSEASNKIFFGAIGFVGTIMVVKGRLTLGSLGAILAYMSQGAAAYTALVEIFRRMISNRIPLEHTAGLLDAEIDVREKEFAPYVKFSGGRVEFKDVSFGYDPGKDVFSGISFVIMPGSRSALVGPSGSGKTTIANLILRLYDANSGSVLLDGRDVKEMSFKSIYSQVGLAPQAPPLWSGSIAEAITYGSSKIDMAAVEHAAELAEIGDFIRRLCGGYDTVLEDMVSTISQGQRQRIAIAAALAKRPKILIMDEACASLDSGTEERIVKNIMRAFPDMTLITISHRLSSARKMDAVYFLKGPCTIIAADHGTLAQSDAEYNGLFAGQLDAVR